MADNKSCEVIGGKRMCGKTTELIRKAFRDQLYILCANRDMARVISKQAEDMGLDIPFPITVDDLPLKSPYINRILVDEVEMVLQQLIGKPVSSMSTSYKLKDMTSLKGDKSLGSFHVDIDCSDALTGLKAVKREARKATGALKEFEQAYNDTKSIADECNVSGQELFSLLARPEVRK